VLFFLMNTSSRRTSRACNAFMTDLPQEVLHKKSWDEDHNEL